MRIFACFTRSYDDPHKDTANFNLISSIVLAPCSYDPNRFSQFLIDGDKTKYIIKVVSNGRSAKLRTDIKYEIINKNLTIITVTLDELLHTDYEDSSTFKEKVCFFNTIFGFLVNDGRNKEIAKVANNCLFEFENDMI